MNKGKACNPTPAVALDKYAGVSSCSAAKEIDSLQIYVAQHAAGSALTQICARTKRLCYVLDTPPLVCLIIRL